MNLISNLPLKKYIISFILAFIITLAALAAASIAFTFLPPPAWLVEGLHDYAFLISGFAAAFLCARASSGRGFITGIISADIYIALLVILGGLVFKNSAPALSVIRIFTLGSVCGAVGGILGINCK